MRISTRTALTRLIALSALVALLLTPTALAATGGGRDAVEPRCAGANQEPDKTTLHFMRSSVLCLVNRVRERYDLAPLAYSLPLRRSATGHSMDMVRHGYFSHDSPGGSTIGTRIASAGYLTRAGTFVFGENIGGGGLRAGSPLAVFRSWMHSPPHRANILNPDFHDFGVGVARGYPPAGGVAAATYTLDLGMRQ